MAARKSPLRVAQPGETPPEQLPAQNLEEATFQSERDLLVMMRTKLATEIDTGVAAAYLAPLIRQLREIDKEIRLLDVKAKQEAGDDGVSPDEAFDAAAI